MRKVSNDRMSGLRRSARLERRSPRHDENNCAAVGMLDQARGEKRRQLRRLRNERVRREINRGADGAVIVAVVAGMLGRKRLHLRARTGDCCPVIRAMDAAEMDVPERQDKLKRKRGKRQATAKPPNVTSPAHQANSTPSPRSRGRITEPTTQCNRSERDIAPQFPDDPSRPKNCNFITSLEARGMRS